MICLDGSKATLYMEFKKKMHSAQGMSIWQDKAFILYDTGCCGVYDLKSRSPQPSAFFQLGSYNPGIPSMDYKNHANSCMFSNIHWMDNPIPLLYVTIGNGTGKDDDGFYYRCAVENIVCTTASDGTEEYHAETLQIISYKPEGIESVPFESPCWGCPAFFVDCDAGDLYIFSARYRTKRNMVPEGEKNAYIVSRFALPQITSGFNIHLTPNDIHDQFTVDSDVLFTQGGTLYNHRIYYTFGCPKIDYPNQLMVVDLHEKKMIALVDRMDAAFRFEEIECCEYYHGKWLCNTSDGSIFELEENLLPVEQEREANGKLHQY